MSEPGKKIIVILGGALKKTSSGKWRTTNYGEGDKYGLSGDRLRVVAGYNLYSKDKHLGILASGGRGQYRGIPGVPTLAAVIKKELVELGVSPGRISLEQRSNNTFQQLLALQKRVKDIKDRFVVISNAHHLPRIKAMVGYGPRLARLKLALSRGNLKIRSAESILLRADPATWSAPIKKARSSPAMKERIALETKGVEEIKNGSYNFH